jgi:hypothetical protein
LVRRETSPASNMFLRGLVESTLEELVASTT